GKGSVGGCKQEAWGPHDARDWFRGDQWDHVAFDPDSRLVLEVVVGKRLDTTAEVLLEGLKGRLGDEPPALVTSDGYAAYGEALLGLFGREVTPPRTGKRGRPAGPRVEAPAGSGYARPTKHKREGRPERGESEGAG